MQVNDFKKFPHQLTQTFTVRFRRWVFLIAQKLDVVDQMGKAKLHNDIAIFHVFR